jgi:hypothetical protein
MSPESSKRGSGGGALIHPAGVPKQVAAGAHPADPEELFHQIEEKQVRDTRN